MLNQIVIVGRLVKDPELRQTEGGKKVTNITLAVPRSYKNSNGEYRMIRTRRPLVIGYKYIFRLK